MLYYRKDYINQVPPRTEGIVHKGLLWLQFDFNLVDLYETCTKIHPFFQLHEHIDQSIWRVKKDLEEYAFKRSYPQPRDVIHV